MWIAIGTYTGPRSAHALLRYAGAVVADRDEARAYRTYVTDSLWYQAQGKALRDRFADLLRPREEIDVEGTIDRISQELEVN